MQVTHMHMVCQGHRILGVFEGVRLSAKARPVYCVLREATMRNSFL